MELEELAPRAESFAAFCARFDNLFERSESRGQARKYLRGLLAPVERKTTWQATVQPDLRSKCKIGA